MFRVSLAVSIVLLAVAGTGLFRPDGVSRSVTPPPEPVESQADVIIDNGRPEVVTIQTTAGDLVLALNSEAAPFTVDAFVRNITLGTYDGSAFFEVDPKSAYLGTRNCSGELRLLKHVSQPHRREADNGLQHRRGTVSLRVVSGVKGLLDDYEFFISSGANPELDGMCTVFATVVDGLGIVDQLFDQDSKMCIEVTGFALNTKEEMGL